MDNRQALSQQPPRPASSLKTSSLQSLDELVTQFNNPTTSDKDKQYLKTVMAYIILSFKALPLKTQAHIEEFTLLALADDQEVYHTTINLLGSEVNQPEIFTNHFTLRALTHAIWLNQQQTLTTQELNHLLTIALNKLDASVINLTLFGALFNAMINAKVSGIEQELIDKFEKKFNNMLNHLSQMTTRDDQEELQFRISCAYQALLRIGTDQSEFDRIRPRLQAGFWGLLKVAGVATSLTSVGLTGGATAALAIPMAIQGLIDSANDFSKAFKVSGKKSWYTALCNLQTALLTRCEKSNYEMAEIIEIQMDLNAVKEQLKTNSRLTGKRKHYLKYGIIDTLKQIALAHPDNKIQQICFNILKDCLSENYHNKALHRKLCLSVANIIQQNTTLQPILQNDYWQGNINSQDFETITHQVEQLQQAASQANPMPLSMTLLELGQQAADKALNENKAKPIIEAIFFENGSMVKDSTFKGNRVVGFDVTVPENASNEQIQHIESLQQQILEGVSKIRAVMVEKGANLTNVTAVNNLVSGYGTTMGSSAAAINQQRQQTGMHTIVPIEQPHDTASLAAAEKKTPSAMRK